MSWNPSMREDMDLISMDNNKICSDIFHPLLCSSGFCRSGAPNEDIVQNHLT